MSEMGCSEWSFEWTEQGISTSQINPNGSAAIKSFLASYLLDDCVASCSSLKCEIRLPPILSFCSGSKRRITFQFITSATELWLCLYHGQVEDFQDFLQMPFRWGYEEGTVVTDPVTTSFISVPSQPWKALITALNRKKLGPVSVCATEQGLTIQNDEFCCEQTLLVELENIPVPFIPVRFNFQGFVACLPLAAYSATILLSLQQDQYMGVIRVAIPDDRDAIRELLLANFSRTTALCTLVLDYLFSCPSFVQVAFAPLTH